MKKVTIKTTTNEILTIQTSNETSNQSILEELLNGKQEFVMIGDGAVSKPHIVYVMIQEIVDEPKNIENSGTTEPADTIGEQGSCCAPDHPICPCDTGEIG